MAAKDEPLILSENTSLVRSETEYQSTQHEHGEDVGLPNNDTDIEHNTCSTSRNKNETISAKSADADEKSGFKVLTSLSGRRKYTLLFITSASFLAGVNFSLMGPMYPLEASKKGMNSTLIGFVFGTFALVIFLTSPFFGTFLTTIGPKFTFLSGIFVGGCCNVLFGTLIYFPSGTPFIALSILIRATEAVGFSAFITSSFAIVSSEFKDSIGIVFGVMETAIALGVVLGPTIGGAFYELGGFGLPFYIGGVFVLLNGILAYYFLPTVEEVDRKRRGSFLSLLRNPTALVAVGSLFIGQSGMTTFYSTLAKHAEPLGLSVAEIGFLFGGMAFIYSVTSLVWGYISDNLNLQSPLLIGGQFIFGAALLLLGPSVLFPFLTLNLAIVTTSMLMIGISFGCIFIPTMKCMLIGALEMGFENDIDTLGLVSGLFNAANMLGGFIGPVGIGAIVEDYGYSAAYTVVGLANLFWVVVCAVFFSIRRHRKMKTGYKEIDEDALKVPDIGIRGSSLSLSIRST